MQKYTAFIVGALVCYANLVFAQPQCDAPELSVEKILEIIATERAKRSDLPKPFTNYEWVIVSEECHYRYGEFDNSFGRGKERYFVLNRRGIIIDQNYGHP